MIDNDSQVLLRRTVRFCVNSGSDKGLQRSVPTSSARPNTFAATPAMTGLGAFYEIEVACRGQPDEQTGYLLNISAIDRAVRTTVVPSIQRAFNDARRTQPMALLRSLFEGVRQELGAIVDEVRWRLTPYYSLAMSSHSTDRVNMTQSFEFSAAHRLHVDSLNDAANREIFGKCNNPSGHGHNYRIEVTVAVPLPSGESEPGMTLTTLERIVGEQVIDRFDHKHLNHDTAEFATINPSVENIARVCHRLLKQPLADAGGTLGRVTIWETEKTSCTYPA